MFYKTMTHVSGEKPSPYPGEISVNYSTFSLLGKDCSYWLPFAQKYECLNRLFY